jgi:hypothetical protein
MAVVLFLGLNLDSSLEMKNPAKLEDDAPKGSVDNTCGIQHGPIETADVLKQKIIKRKLLFSNYSMHTDSLIHHIKVIMPVALRYT